MTTKFNPIAGGTHELVADIGHGFTYRMLDHWLRRGYVTLATDGFGSGHPRQITPAEAAAIRELVDVYEQALATLAEIRSGEMYATILAGLEEGPC